MKLMNKTSYLTREEAKELVALQNDVEDIKKSIVAIKIFVRSQEEKELWEK